MSGNRVNSASTQTGSAKWYRQIRFQVLFLNILLLAAFLLTNLSAQGSISNLARQSNYMLRYNTGLLSAQSDLQYRITGLQIRDEAYINATAATRSDINDSITNIEKGITASFDEFDKYTALYTDKNISDSINSIKAQAEKIVQDTEDIRSLVGSGDLTAARKTYSESVNPEIETIVSDISELRKLCNKIADTAEKETSAIGRRSAVTMYVMLAVAIVCLLLNYLTTYIEVIKKIRSMTAEINAIEKGIIERHGDLTARIKTSTESELMFVKSGINSLIASLQSAMKSVKTSTSALNENNDIVMQQIESVNDSVTSTSAALEELSAGMETVSENTGDLHEKVANIRDAADAILSQAEAGNKSADTIKAEADAIKANAEQKKNDTGIKTQQLSEILAQAVKDSEKVKQIDALTETILDIASQTNLLSLNASIEAARAGEAGKGFAVVAGEISELAAHSRETASNIQEISKDVTAAVKNLSDNAVNVIDYINETVIPDYDSYVETGSKYEKSADILKFTLGKFTERADNLGSIVDEMTKSMDTIATSVKESSVAINSSAENSAKIVEQVQGINEAMDKSSDVINELVETTAAYSRL